MHLFIYWKKEEEELILATAIPTIKIMVGLWLSLNPKE